MTLERCDNFFDFIIKRWLRLFPAMLICTLIIFITAGFFNERPNGDIDFKDLIPGLLFIEPYYLSKVIGDVKSIENAFWSLYVEFKFYFISAIIFYLLGKKKLVHCLFLLFLVWFISFVIQFYTDNRIIYILYAASTHLSLKYFGWFAAGSSFYFFTKTQNKNWLYYAIFICLCSAFALAVENASIHVFFAVITICILFSLSVVSLKIQKLLSHKFLLFLGYISYPLYLLHENIMISLIIKFQHWIPDNMVFFLPLLAILFISYIAYIVSKFLETPVRKFILKPLNKFN